MYFKVTRVSTVSILIFLPVRLSVALLCQGELECPKLSSDIIQLYIETYIIEKVMIELQIIAFTLRYLLQSLQRRTTWLFDCALL